MRSDIYSRTIYPRAQCTRRFYYTIMLGSAKRKESCSEHPRLARDKTPTTGVCVWGRRGRRQFHAQLHHIPLQKTKTRPCRPPNQPRTAFWFMGMCVLATKHHLFTSKSYVSAAQQLSSPNFHLLSAQGSLPRPRSRDRAVTIESDSLDKHRETPSFSVSAANCPSLQRTA